MRQHIGYHLLTDGALRPANSLPCGLCGGPSSQFSSDLSQAVGCAVWLKGRSAQPEIACKLLGRTTFSMVPAKKCAASTPCTNVPLKCPVCPSKPGVVHWKLNMIEHFKRAHGGKLPEGFALELHTTEQELQWVSVVGRAPNNKVNVGAVVVGPP
jgi:hypothetical protein